MLIVTIEGQPFVQAVRLDDPSPGYASTYVRHVARYCDPDAVLRWAEVDVSSVAEHGPNDIAAMLSEDTQEERGLATDLPQRWESRRAGDIAAEPV
jgi:hypothetical protein